MLNLCERKLVYDIKMNILRSNHYLTIRGNNETNSPTTLISAPFSSLIIMFYKNRQRNLVSKQLVCPTPVTVFFT
jgi:hypothetical protein